MREPERGQAERTSTAYERMQRDHHPLGPRGIHDLQVAHDQEVDERKHEPAAKCEVQQVVMCRRTATSTSNGIRTEISFNDARHLPRHETTSDGADVFGARCAAAP